MGSPQREKCKRSTERREKREGEEGVSKLGRQSSGWLVKHPPLVQVMIPEPWDGVRSRAPCSAGSLLLPFPLLVALSVSDKEINKIFFKKIREAV